VRALEYEGDAAAPMSDVATAIERRH